jgi:hypothetical protein
MRLSFAGLSVGLLCGVWGCAGAKPKKVVPDYAAIQARAAAVAQARDLAMRDFLGVEVRSHSLVFQQEDLRHNDSLVENVLRTIRHGHILKEEMIADGYQDMQGCPSCRYGVDLKTCMTPLPDSHDKAFRVDLQLFRDRLVEGDEAQLSVSCSKDCYVYLYNVGLDWETAVLVPNAALPEVKLKAGDVFQYPNEALKRQGIHLVAQLPPGKSGSAETIRVVASESPLSQDLRDPSNGGYLNLIRRLIAAGTDWAEDTAAFTIYQH